MQSIKSKFCFLLEFEITITVCMNQKKFLFKLEYLFLSGLKKYLMFAYYYYYYFCLKRFFIPYMQLAYAHSELTKVLTNPKRHLCRFTRQFAKHKLNGYVGRPTLLKKFFTVIFISLQWLNVPTAVP